MTKQSFSICQIKIGVVIMSEKFAVGQVLKGKVTGVQPYGAFVALDDKVQGLVHISELAHGFVKDINEYVAVGDEVNVKILSIDEANNKYSLSIRATEEAPEAKKQTSSAPQDDEGFNTLKDKLGEWLKQSEQNK